MKTDQTPQRLFCIVLVEGEEVLAALLAESRAELGHTICAYVATEDAAVAPIAHPAPDMMVVDVQLAFGSGVAVMVTILSRCVMPHLLMTGEGARTRALEQAAPGSAARLSSWESRPNGS